MLYNAIGFSRVLSMDQPPTNSQCCNGWIRRCGSRHSSRSSRRHWVHRCRQRHGSTRPTAPLRKVIVALKVASPSTLPIGVGFLVFAIKLDGAFEEISRHHPAIIWLACPFETEDLETWSKAMRTVSPSSRIWIQIASVAVSLSVAETCSPDVLILQVTLFSYCLITAPGAPTTC